MAAELEDCCPVCLDSWQDGSFAVPCLHRFCYLCILQWAETKPECPLCKRTITSIVHSVRRDDDFQEHAVRPSVVARQAEEAPGHPASLPGALGLLPRAPVGGLYPHRWASLFRGHRDLLRPVELWLGPALGRILEGQGPADIQGSILHTLCVSGPDKEALVQLLLPALGSRTRAFVRQLLETIEDECSEAALRRMGLGHPGAAEGQEGRRAAAPSPAATQRGTPAPTASAAALGADPASSPSAPVSTPGEQGPQQGLEEAVPGPSAPSQGRQRSRGGPWRARKRRAGSPDAHPPASKRPPRRQT